MSPVAARSVVVVLLVAVGAGFAVAQTEGPASSSDIAGFTCSDISLLPVANQAALIYYIAGYRDGAAAASSAPPSDTPRQAPVLNLDARRIVLACADAPGRSIADLIAADDGGSSGMGTLEASLGLERSSASSSAEIGRVIVPRSSTDNWATDAVSANLSAASENLQRSIDRPPLAAPAPFPGAP